MKYIYILGMEHSGSTLVSSLIAQNRSAVALGEVSRFLSPAQIGRYQQRWGKHGAAVTCSCGKTWWDCPFWSALEPFWGLNEKVAKLERFRGYFAYLRSIYPSDVSVVDSSKTLEDVSYIVENIDQFPLELCDIRVLLVAKDPRSFALSVKRKNDGKLSILNTVRAFNWWYAMNNRNLTYLHEKSIPWSCIQYERLCFDRGKSLARIFCANPEPRQAAEELQNHIVLSNKDFLSQESLDINYDYRWFSDTTIQWCYLLHPRVARLNRQLYQLNSGEAA